MCATFPEHIPLASWLGATMPKINGKRIRDEFISRKDDNTDVWVCKCGTSRKGGRGYTNFVSHIQSQHPKDLECYLMRILWYPQQQMEKAFLCLTQERRFKFMAG